MANVIQNLLRHKVCFFVPKFIDPVYVKKPRSWEKILSLPLGTLQGKGEKICMSFHFLSFLGKLLWAFLLNDDGQKHAFGDVSTPDNSLTVFLR